MLVTLVRGVRQSHSVGPFWAKNQKFPHRCICEKKQACRDVGDRQAGGEALGVERQSASWLPENIPATIKKNKNKDGVMDNREEHKGGDLLSKREDAMRRLLAAAQGAPTKTLIDELKQGLGVSRATAYRMVRSFRSCGAITSSSRSVGRPKGTRGLDPKRERIIEEALGRFIAAPERPRFSALVQEIARRCKECALPPPNWRTIRARLRDIDNQRSNA